MQARFRKKNNGKIVAILIAVVSLLCLTALLFQSFAWFKDEDEEVNTHQIGRIELSENVSSQNNLSIPISLSRQTVLENDIIFTPTSDTSAFYTRFEVSYALDASTSIIARELMKYYPFSPYSTSVTTETNFGLTWTRIGDYYYLCDNNGVPKSLSKSDYKENDSDCYVFLKKNSILINPRMSSELFKENGEITKDLFLNINVETVQARNICINEFEGQNLKAGEDGVVDSISDIEWAFTSQYPTSNYSVTFKDQNEATISTVANIPYGGSAAYIASPTILEGQVFVEWNTQKNGSGAKITQAQLSNITEDITVYLITRPISVNVHISYGPNGTITPNNGNNTTYPVTYGDDLTLLIKPYAGYYIDTLTVNSINQNLEIQYGEIMIYTFENLTQNQSISATFAVRMFTISLTEITEGLTESEKQLEYSSISLPFNTELHEVALSPLTGYYITSLIVDGKNITTFSPNGDSYEFRNIMSNHELVVTYTPIVYTLNYERNGGSEEIGKTNAPNYTVITDDIVFNPVLKSDNIFVGWYDNESFTGNAIPKIEKGSIGNRTLYAKFIERPVDNTIDNYGYQIFPNYNIINASNVLVEDVSTTLETIAKLTLNGNDPHFAIASPAELNVAGAVSQVRVLLDKNSAPIDQFEVWTKNISNSFVIVKKLAEVENNADTWTTIDINLSYFINHIEPSGLTSGYFLIRSIEYVSDVERTNTGDVSLIAKTTTSLPDNLTYTYVWKDAAEEIVAITTSQNNYLTLTQSGNYSCDITLKDENGNDVISPYSIDYSVTINRDIPNTMESVSGVYTSNPYTVSVGTLPFGATVNYTYTGVLANGTNVSGIGNSFTEAGNYEVTAQIDGKTLWNDKTLNANVMISKAYLDLGVTSCKVLPGDSFYNEITSLTATSIEGLSYTSNKESVVVDSSTGVVTITQTNNIDRSQATISIDGGNNFYSSTYTIDQEPYTFSNSTTLSKYLGSEAVVSIPSTVSDLNTITGGMITSNTSSRVYSVQNIATNAITYITNLTELRLPTSLISLQNGAIAALSSIMRIVLQNPLPDVGYILAGVREGKWYKDGEVVETMTTIGTYNNTGIVEGISTEWNYELINPSAVIGDADYNKYKIIEYLGPDTDIKIPHRIFNVISEEYDQVTAIETLKEANKASVTSVVISEGITDIYDEAFLSYTSADKIVMPSSIIHIGNRAFKDCSALTTSINIQTCISLISIGQEAFRNSGYGIRGAIDLSDSNYLVSIGSYAFGNAQSLTSFTIPNSVTTIGDNIFINCSKLQNISVETGGTSKFISAVDVFQNASHYKSGYYINNNSETPHGSYRIFQMEVIPGQTYRIINSAGSTSPGFAYFTSEQTFVAGGDNYRNRQIIDTTVPQNAKYIRVSLNVSENYRAEHNYFALLNTTITDGFSNGTMLFEVSGTNYTKLYSFAIGSTQEKITLPTTINEIKAGALVNAKNIVKAAILSANCPVIYAQTFSGCDNLNILTTASSSYALSLGNSESTPLEDRVDYGFINNCIMYLKGTALTPSYGYNEADKLWYAISTIVVSQSANGTITPSGIIYAIAGLSYSFIITPDEGFYVSAIMTQDGNQIDSITLNNAEPQVYTFTNIQVGISYTLTATFIEKAVEVVHEDNHTYFDNINSALTYASGKSGVVMTLLKNMTYSNSELQSLTTGTNIDFYSNYTLTFSSNAVLTINNGATLSLYNGTIIAGSGYAINNNGVLNIYGGYINKETAGTTINNLNTINIYGGEITGPVVCQNGSTLNITAGSINGLVTTNGTAFNMSGGNINHSGEVYSLIIQNATSTTTANISGGIINQTINYISGTLNLSDSPVISSIAMASDLFITNTAKLSLQSPITLIVASPADNMIIASSSDASFLSINQYAMSNSLWTIIKDGTTLKIFDTVVTFDAMGGNVSPVSKQVNYQSVLTPYISNDLQTWTISNANFNDYATCFSDWSFANSMTSFVFTGGNRWEHVYKEIQLQKGNIYRFTYDYAYPTLTYSNNGYTPSSGMRLQLWNTIPINNGGGSQVVAQSVTSIDAVSGTSTLTYNCQESGTFYLSFNCGWLGDAVPINVSFGNFYCTYSSYGNIPIPTKPGYTFEGWYNNKNRLPDATMSGLTHPSGFYSILAENFYPADYYTISAIIARGENDNATNVRLSIHIEYTDNSIDRTMINEAYGYPACGETKFVSATVARNKTKAIKRIYGFVFDYSVPNLPRDISATNIQLEGSSQATQFAPYGYVDSASEVITHYDHSLYAFWTVNDYQITFDPKGGIVSPTSKTVTFDTALGELPTPTRTGYVFNRWLGENLINPVSISNGYIDQYNTSENLNTNDLNTYTTDWITVIPNSNYYYTTSDTRCRVQFKNANGVITYYSGSAENGESRIITTASDTVKMRIYFSRNLANNTATLSRIYTSESIVDEPRNLTLYADWTPSTYNINYVSLDTYTGETGGNFLNTNHLIDWSKNLTIELDFSRVSNSQRGLIIGNYSCSNDLNIEITGANQLRLWVKGGIGNGGIDRTDTSSIVPFSQLMHLTYTYIAETGSHTLTAVSETTSLSISATLILTGTSTNTLLSGKDHRGSNSFKPICVGNIVITSGTDATTAYSFEGKEVTYDAPYGSLPTPIRTGYDFAGWNSKNMWNLGDMNGKETASGYYSFLNVPQFDTYTISALINKGFDDTATNTRLTIVLIYTDGTSNSNATHVGVNGYPNIGETKNVSTTVTKNPLKTVSRIYGYIFDYSVPNNRDIVATNIQLEGNSFASQYENYIINSSTPVTTARDHTLRGIWTPAATNITFDKAGGSGGDDGTIAYYEQALPSGLRAPTKTGYDFDGYWIDAECSEKQYYDENMSSHDYWLINERTITLYAKWVACKYAVTFDYSSSIGLDKYDGTGYLDTGFFIDWNNDITIELDFTRITNNQRSIIIGNYNGSNQLNIEITGAHQLRLWVNAGAVNLNTQNDKIPLGQTMHLVYHYSATTGEHNLSATNDQISLNISQVYNMTNLSTTKKSSYSLLVGSDHRSYTTLFYPVMVGNIKITNTVVTYDETYGFIPANITKKGHAFLRWESDNMVNVGTVDEGFIGQNNTDSTLSYQANCFTTKWLDVSPNTNYYYSGAGNRCRVQFRNSSNVITYWSGSSDTGNARTIMTADDTVQMRIYFCNETAVSPWISLVLIPTADSIVTAVANHTFYSSWTPLTSTMIIDSLGGVIPETNGWTIVDDTANKLVTYGDEYGSIPTPTLEGYSLEGWLKAEKGSVEYTQLDYIQSNGSNYINTGYWWKNENTHIYFDGTVLSNPSNQSLFGSEEYTEDEGSVRNFSGIPHGANGNYNIYVGTGGQGSISAPLETRFNLDIITTEEYSLTVKKNGVTVLDSINYTGSVVTNDTNTTNGRGQIYLFANHNCGNNFSSPNLQPTQITSSMRIYAFKLWDNEILVRDLIPVKRVSDNTIGMFDKVTQTFFPLEVVAGQTSNGTYPEQSPGTSMSGTSVFHDAIQYNILDNIESNGEQFINTGVPFSNTLNIDAELALTNTTGSDVNLLGAYGDNNGTSLAVYKGKWRFITSENNVLSNYMVNQKTRIRLDYNGAENYINNTNITINGAITNFSTPFNIYVFGSQHSSTPGNASKPASMKLYSLKIYDGTTLIRHFVPVERSTDYSLGLYDLVNNVFYANPGNRQFFSGEKIAATDIITSEEDFRLRAKWNNTNYLITYNSNTGLFPSGVSQMFDFAAYNKEYLVISGDDLPTKTGYLFDSWKYNLISTNEIINGHFFTTNSTSDELSQKIGCETTPWYPVTPNTEYYYSGNGDRCRVQFRNSSNVITYWSGSADNGNARVITTANDTVYMRVYYSSDLNTCTEIKLLAAWPHNETHIMTLTRDIDVYAHWTPIQYNIVYNANGGYRPMTPSTYTYDVTGTLSANLFVRPGYTFAGWSTTSSGSIVYGDEASILNVSAIHNSNNTIYAIWTAVDYTLTINPNGGQYSGSTATSTVTGSMGEATYVADPIRTGYTFSGWVVTKEAYDATWIQVFYHNTNNGNRLFNSSIVTTNVVDNGKMSILNSLDKMRYNNAYEFLLEYTHVDGYNRWQQTSNPAKVTTSNAGVTGYDDSYSGAHISWSTNSWRGLEYNGTDNAFIDGTVNNNNWYYTIGSYKKWGLGIPGPTQAEQSIVQLWVRCDPSLSNVGSLLGLDSLNSGNNFYFEGQDTTIKALWKPNYQLSYDPQSHVTNELALHYDAINNTGTGHSSSTTSWKDLSGNNNGTLTNFSSGMWENDGLVFDGTNDYVVGSNMSIPKNVTWQASFTATKSPATFIIDQRISNVGYQPMYVNETGVQFYDSTTNDSIYITIDAYLNSLVTLTIVKNGSTIYVYYNGILKGTKTTNISSSTTSSLYIGSRHSVNSGFFKGKIHSIMIYNKALSTDEIEQNVNSINMKYVTKKTISYTNNYGELPTPSRDGYNFEGWYGQDLVYSSPIQQNAWNGSVTNVNKTNGQYIFRVASTGTSAWRTFYLDMSAYRGQAVTLSGIVTSITQSNATFTSLSAGQGNDGTYPYHIYGSPDKVVVATSVPSGNLPFSITCTMPTSGLAIIGVCIWLESATNGGYVDVSLSNFRVETQSVRTPYFVDSSTVIPSEGNHTLYARWTPRINNVILEHPNNYFTRNSYNITCTNSISDGVNSWNITETTNNGGPYLSGLSNYMVNGRKYKIQITAKSTIALTTRMNFEAGNDSWIDINLTSSYQTFTTREFVYNSSSTYSALTFYGTSWKTCTFSISDVKIIQQTTYGTTYGDLASPNYDHYLFREWNNSLFNTSEFLRIWRDTKNYATSQDANSASRVNANNRSFTMIGGTDNYTQPWNGCYNIEVTPNTTYTFSWKQNVISSACHNLVFFYDSASATSYTQTHQDEHYDDALGRYYYTFTTTASTTILKFRFGVNAAQNLTYSEIKLEEGSTPTAYEITSSTIETIPNDHSIYPQYSFGSTLTINPNGGTYDGSTSNKQVSGDYETSVNLSTPTRTNYFSPAWTTNGSLNNFSSSSNLIQENKTFNGSSDFVNLFTAYKYEYTLNVTVLAYMTSWSNFSTNGMKLISCTEAGGWNFKTSADGFMQFSCYDYGVGYKSAISTVAASSLSSGWHMFTGSFDGKYARFYIDGILRATTTEYTSGRIGYNAETVIFVGAEPGSSTQTPDGSYFNGIIKFVSISNTPYVSNLKYTFSNSHETITATWATNSYPSAFTLTINPNGGTYDGSTFNKQITGTYGTSVNLSTPSKVNNFAPAWTTSGSVYNFYTSTNLIPENKVFNGSSDFATISSNKKYTDSINITIVAYMSSWSDFSTGGMRLISCTENGGWNFEPNSNGFMQFACYDSGVGYKRATSTIAASSLSSGWHMFTGSFDGKYARLYIDGVLCATSAEYTSGQISYHADNAIFVGAEAGNNATTPAGNYFNGRIKFVSICNSPYVSNLEYIFLGLNETITATWTNSPSTTISLTSNSYGCYSNLTYSIDGGPSETLSDGSTINVSCFVGSTITITALCIGCEHLGGEDYIFYGIDAYYQTYNASSTPKYITTTIRIPRINYSLNIRGFFLDTTM